MLFKLTNYNRTCIWDLISLEHCQHGLKFLNENALNSMSPFSLSKWFLVCPNSETGHPLPTLVGRLYLPGPTRFGVWQRKNKKDSARRVRPPSFSILSVNRTHINAVQKNFSCVPNWVRTSSIKIKKCSNQKVYLQVLLQQKSSL